MAACRNSADERGVLQQQHPPRLVIAAVLERVVDGVGGRDGVQRHDAGRAHEHFARGLEQRVVDGAGRHTAIEQLHDCVAGDVFIAVTQKIEQFLRGGGIGFAGEPVGADILHELRIAASGSVGREIVVSGIGAPAPVEQRVGERAEDGFRVAPADGLECAPTVRHVDRLVADVAEIARAVAGEQLEALLRAEMPRERRGGHIGGRLIPAIHRALECGTRLMRRRHGGFVERGHRPVALLHIARLGVLELIHGPEQRQPAVAIR